jgi:hypothetical protein
VRVKLLVGLSGPAFPEVGLLALTTCATMALGLLIVVIVRRPEFSVAAALLAMAAMALCARGSLLPPPLADASPTRWAYEGLVLLEIPSAPEKPALPGISQPHGPAACALSLAFMFIGFGAAAAFLSSSDPCSPHAAPS